ncbi:sulfotransferase 1C2-like [Haliotis cracherodii]|uniref:sulfotransferase 1C2-like n=1 Tax=Haliotis cracherodii TaxID=6455 RepID=UPI0039ECDDF7
MPILQGIAQSKRILSPCTCRCVCKIIASQCKWPVISQRKQSVLAHVREWSKQRSYRESRLYTVSFRNFNSSSQQTPFQRKIQIATYISCGIGACLLSAIGWRQYTRFTRKARGAEAIRDQAVTGRQIISYRYRGFIIPAFMVDNLDDLHRFQVREEDIWIVTFPKAGTTWLQEIVYLIANDLDFEKARSKILEERFPYLEFVNPGMKAISKMESPRFIKTHLPPSLLPREVYSKNPKLIYLARNPKDTVVSYYHFTKSLATISYFGDFSVFFDQFLNDKAIYGPWWKHVKEGWNLRDKDNVLFLTYEDLHKDTRGCIRTVANFLGKSLSDQQVETLARHVTFASMKVNPSVNYSWWAGWAVKEGHENQFFRKGIVGDWTSHLNPEMSRRIDDMVAEKLQGTQLVLEDMPRSRQAS